MILLTSPVIMTGVESGPSCGSVAWNVVQASQSLSALAGLIGGFVLTGMIVLLVERPRHTERPKEYAETRIPALMLFFAGFISLGLNSYVFGLISGEDPDACRRIWTAAAVSSGMLATGVVAAVGGVVLLIHAYLKDRRADLSDKDSAVIIDQFTWLDKLLRSGILLIALMVGLLLIARHTEALWVWVGEDLVLALPAVIIGSVVSLFVVVYILVSNDRPRQPDSTALCRRLFWGATITVLHAVIGTVLIGGFLTFANGDWEAAGDWWGWVIAIQSLVPATAVYLFGEGVAQLMRPKREKAPG